MSVERVPGSSSLIDVLDRILDKGIVIDAWVRISLDGIDVLSNDTRVIVTAVDLCLNYDGSVAAGRFAAQAAPGSESPKSRRAGGHGSRGRR